MKPILRLVTVLFALCFLLVFMRECEATTLTSNPEVEELARTYLEREKALQIEETFKLITEHEGFRAKCYPDGRGYSQGFGHYCLGGAISKENSKNILLKEIKRLEAKIPPQYNWKERVGITSFIYNHPVRQNYYLKLLRENEQEFRRIVTHKATHHTYIKGIRYGGLLTRRKAELAWINNQI